MADPELREYAMQGAKARGLDTRIVDRMFMQESGYNPRAVSPAGAAGVGQLMPPHWSKLPSGDPFNAHENIDYALDLLRSHLQRFGNYELALAAYNAGPGNVMQYNGVPPFEETQRYVRKILGDTGDFAVSFPTFTGIGNLPSEMQKLIAQAQRLFSPGPTRLSNDATGSLFRRELDTLLSRLLGGK